MKDELTIPRPCIDMTDEGYNVEWSQELTLDAVGPRVRRRVGPRARPARTAGMGRRGARPAAVFDMSVGYNFDGIASPRMTRFLDVMADASDELPRSGLPASPVPAIRRHRDSPLHRQQRHALDDARLPAGRDRAHCPLPAGPAGPAHRRQVESDAAGPGRSARHRQPAVGLREIDIPDAVFDHDLRYDRAVDLIARLKRAGAERGLTFGVKLSNTLPTRNHTGRLPGDQIYMSGRSLYPVTMNLFDRLLHSFNGDLHVSYSAGVDALNVATVLSCGALPVTGCTDLLKPGGYARLTNWLARIGTAMNAAGATSAAEFSRDRLSHVGRAAAEALSNPRTRRTRSHGLPKVASGLGPWDCVVAPCVEACAVEQDVPEYAWLIAQGEYDRALKVILARNPLPGVTGYVCTRLCETRCTRNDYEETVAIRALKRIAEERGRAEYASKRAAATGRRVAIVGGGPSGLAAAAFLALNGVQATIFEAKDVAGGMLRTVPPFRLPSEIIERDIGRIRALGVTIALNTKISAPPEELLARGFDAVYLAAGFQRDAPLDVPGIDGAGVVAALAMLERARRGQTVTVGKHPVVVGGGDTAMDAARTAQRLSAARSRSCIDAPAGRCLLPWRNSRARSKKAIASKNWSPRWRFSATVAPSSASGACATNWANAGQTEDGHPKPSPGASSLCRATRSSWRSASAPSWHFWMEAA